MNKFEEFLFFCPEFVLNEFCLRNVKIIACGPMWLCLQIAALYYDSDTVKQFEQKDFHFQEKSSELYINSSKSSFFKTFLSFKISLKSILSQELYSNINEIQVPWEEKYVKAFYSTKVSKWGKWNEAKSLNEPKKTCRISINLGFNGSDEP